MPKVKVPLDLLECLVDSGDCWYDHHGGCQEHGYLMLNPGELCPQLELKQIIAKQKKRKFVKTLSDMTVNEAASLAIELMAHGEWDNQKNRSWCTAREGTFAEHMQSYFDDNEVYDNASGNYIPADQLTNFDYQAIWEYFKSEGGEGTRDGWTGKLVESYGGEGGGENYWAVISVSDGTTTRYFRRDGYYSSYGNGGELDGETVEVTPVERTVVFYE